MSRLARDHRRARKITFPEFSKILDGRDNLVDVLSKSFSDVKSDPVLIVCGASATRSHASVYHRLLRRAGWSQPCLPATPIPDRGTKQQIEAWGDAEARRAFGRFPRMVVYVGGQSVGDAAKVLVRHWRGDGDEPLFGGILTALSTDGIFAKNASLRDDNGLSKTEEGTPPDFVLGHRLTLLRQPYHMKRSCLGDILAKASSLWDYDYACRKLSRYHDDFAADLVRSAYEPLLLRGEEESEDDRLARPYLHLPSSIDDLFRAIQLCGLSMQLLNASDTCSGSEHLGQKWLDEYVASASPLQGRGNASAAAESDSDPPSITRDGPVPRSRRLSHGESVLPMCLITLYMQGQAGIAERIKRISVQTEMAATVAALGIPARVLCACLTLGLGYRCPAYLAYMLDIAEFPDEAKDGAQRITILEQQEVSSLPGAVRYAMLDSGVATDADFSVTLHESELRVLNKLVERAIAGLKRAWNSQHLSASSIEAGERVLRGAFAESFCED